MITVVILIVAVALLWGGWPLVVRLAGGGNPFNTLVLVVMAMTPIAFMAIIYTDKRTVLETTYQTFASLAMAGLMMGSGLIFFNMVLTNKEIEISAVVPVINVSMMLVTIVGGICFFGESMTPIKIIGILFLIIGIVLVRPVVPQ